MKVWKVVEQGNHVPMKKSTTKVGEVSKEVEIPKDESEFDDDDLKKISLNKKAINFIHCALNENDYMKISTWKLKKEVKKECFQVVSDHFMLQPPGSSEMSWNMILESVLQGFRPLFELPKADPSPSQGYFMMTWQNSEHFDARREGHGRQRSKSDKGMHLER
ncbi:hypothetical protein PIB30_086210 [Stylosanthes scabra]|uniref:Uncharacterized protein n=1 Tax=Stylosanthes scabra TaxID=79078 RepID=A0ABU6VRS8_9FABA|nr:hypothetical protein [Stylosanthes scabra]